METCQRETLEAMDLEPVSSERRAIAPPRDTRRDWLVHKFEDTLTFAETCGHLPHEEGDEDDDLDESSLGSAFLAI